jgi:hypothetical protein
MNNLQLSPNPTSQLENLPEGTASQGAVAVPNHLESQYVDGSPKRTDSRDEIRSQRTSEGRNGHENLGSNIVSDEESRRCPSVQNDKESETSPKLPNANKQHDKETSSDDSQDSDNPKKASSSPEPNRDSKSKKHHRPVLVTKRKVLSAYRSPTKTFVPAASTPSPSTYRSRTSPKFHLSPPSSPV